MCLCGGGHTEISLPEYCSPFLLNKCPIIRHCWLQNKWVRNMPVKRIFLQWLLCDAAFMLICVSINHKEKKLTSSSSGVTITICHWMSAKQKRSLLTSEWSRWFIIHLHLMTVLCSQWEAPSSWGCISLQTCHGPQIPPPWLRGLSSDPANGLFILLPSDKHYRSMRGKTARFRNSIFPQAIRLLSSHWHTQIWVAGLLKHMYPLIESFVLFLL